MNNNLPVKKNGFIETIKNFFKNLFKKKKSEEAVDVLENLNNKTNNTTISNQETQDELINKYKVESKGQTKPHINTERDLDKEKEAFLDDLAKHPELLYNFPIEKLETIEKSYRESVEKLEIKLNNLKKKNN